MVDLFLCRPTRAAWIAMGVLGSLACFGLGPQLSPKAVGCYQVHASAWSHKHAALIGFRALPTVIALDTANLGRVLVPPSWRYGDPPNTNTADLALVGAPTRRVGDLILFDRREAPKPFKADSIAITFRGWGGYMTAFLERSGDGFAGYAAFAPLMTVDDVPPLMVSLSRDACPAALMPGM